MKTQKVEKAVIAENKVYMYAYKTNCCKKSSAYIFGNKFVFDLNQNIRKEDLFKIVQMQI